MWKEARSLLKNSELEKKNLRDNLYQIWVVIQPFFLTPAKPRKTAHLPCSLALLQWAFMHSRFFLHTDPPSRAMRVALPPHTNRAPIQRLAQDQKVSRFFFSCDGTIFALCDSCHDTSVSISVDHPRSSPPKLESP